MRGDTNFKDSDSSDPSVYFLFCAITLYIRPWFVSCISASLLPILTDVFSRYFFSFVLLNLFTHGWHTHNISKMQNLNSKYKVYDQNTLWWASNLNILIVKIFHLTDINRHNSAALFPNFTNYPP